MHIFFFILSLLFSPFFLLSSEISLKEQLAEAEPGSYLVTEQNKIYTFIHINERQQQSIVLEEVVVSAAQFSHYQLSWRDWFQQGAPGHTSWVMSQINLSTGKLEELYSFLHESWIDTSQVNGFMTTLLNLRFKEIPESQRRRIGPPPPGYGKPDRRPLWNPRLVVDGKVIPDISFTAWKSRWPCDGSELSQKTIEIYLPTKEKGSRLLSFPTYFPFWLEVDGKIGSAKIRVVDSGLGVQSPKSRLPHRSPQFLGNGSLEEDGLALYLKSPSYYQDFIVIAEEVDAVFGKTVVLPCEIFLHEETVILFIPKNELDKFLIPGEKYQFIVSPKEDLGICIETPAPLLYR